MAFLDQVICGWCWIWWRAGGHVHSVQNLHAALQTMEGLQQGYICTECSREG